MMNTYDLAEMAADVEIQNELQRIEDEFSFVEADGLDIGHGSKSLTMSFTICSRGILAAFAPARQGCRGYTPKL